MLKNKTFLLYFNCHNICMYLNSNQTKGEGHCTIKTRKALVDRQTNSVWGGQSLRGTSCAPMGTNQIFICTFSFNHPNIYLYFDASPCKYIWCFFSLAFSSGFIAYPIVRLTHQTIFWWRRGSGFSGDCKT